MPSLSAAVVQDGRLVWAEAFGWAEGVGAASAWIAGEALKSAWV